MLNHSSTQIRVIVAAALALLGACTAPAPSPEMPVLDLPTAAIAPVSIDRQWWRAFGDPLLDQLVDEALINNIDLAKAAANVEEARANAGVARAMLSPRLDGAAKIGVTQRQLTFAINEQELNKVTGSGSLGAGVSWEIDLWGRIRQMNEAALAQLSASEHARNATILAVSSAVTDIYIQLCALDAKLLMTRNAVRDLKYASHLEYRRWKAEVGTELAYRQSQAEVSATEARIPAVETAIAQTELSLQLLVGRSPRQMAEYLSRGAGLKVPLSPREFDSALLLRRPDVASAEQLLIAANADVNATRAERYPRLNLSLLAGLIASSSGLISGFPLFIDGAAGLTGPIYDAGLVQSKTEGAEARRDKAVAHYRYTVSVAFRDVYEAMVLRDTSDSQVASSETEVATRKKSLALTQKSYDAGRSSKFEVLGESIKVLNAELALADARQNQLIARSRFYKALGGGF
ncbi:MAG: efflux transporter outer membrane subunit [Rhodocyclaceae bacterium]|nr:efflux transporter outer membrane subunit [Rhodocyclaceae bacterium]